MVTNPWLISVLVFLFSSIFTISQFIYMPYGQGIIYAQGNLTNTDSTLSQHDSSSLVSTSETDPSESTTGPQFDESITDTDSQRMVPDSTEVNALDLNSPIDSADSSTGSDSTQEIDPTNNDHSGLMGDSDKEPGTILTSNNASGEGISNGHNSPGSGSTGEIFGSDSGISSNSNEQTRSLDISNQSSGSLLTDTVTENYHPSQDDGSISSTLNSSISMSSWISESPSPSTDMLGSTNQSSSGLSIKSNNQSSGPSAAVNTVNKSSSEPIRDAAVNKTVAASDHLSSAVPNSNVSSMSHLLEIASVQTETTNPNAIVQPVSPGSKQEINFGDVSNGDHMEATVSLDKSNYAVSDTPKVTVNDPEANLDPNVINTVQVLVTTDFVPDGILVTLTETSPDSGIFEGTFGFVNDGGPGGLDSIGINPQDQNPKIKVHYSAPPRAKVLVDGVVEGGVAQLAEVLINSVSPLTRAGINLSLTDGAQLVPATNPEITEICTSTGGSSAQTCGGNITITMSYANIPLTGAILPEVGCQEACTPIPVTVSPSNLTIFERVGETWIPLDLHGEITVDENTKTLTATSPFGPGIFIIGIKSPNDSNGGGSGGGSGGGVGCDASDSVTMKAGIHRSGSVTAAAAGGGVGGGPGCGSGGNGGGGGGGGLAFPDDGVVLDFIVGVAQPQSPPPPPPSPPPSSPPVKPESDSPLTERSISDLESDTNLTTTSLSTFSSNPITDSNAITQTLAESSNPLALSVEGKRNDNFTVSIPGEGNVTLNYLTFTTGENFTVSTLKAPSELAALNITKVQNSQQRSLSTLNNTNYSIISTVFNIGPNDAKINGTITVSIPYNNTSLLAQNGEEDVRLFEYTGSAWEDVTSKPPATANLVTGSVSSVGPVVAAVRSTFH
jgi:hypothetical protein